jgi:hypothetical protein
VPVGAMGGSEREKVPPAEIPINLIRTGATPSHIFIHFATTSALKIRSAGTSTSNSTGAPSLSYVVYQE